MNKKMEELKALAEAKALELNELRLKNKSIDKIEACQDAIDGAVSDYNSLAQNEVFTEIRKADDPMLEAVTRLTYTGIKAKDVWSGKGELKTRMMTIEEAEKVIDLQKLHKFCPDGIGAKKNWIYIVEKFNCLLTASKALSLGIDVTEINDSYYMNQVSKDIALGKTPTSKTQLMKVLQTVVDAMLGEDKYKVTSHDIEFLTSIYTKKSRKALTVTCANHRQLRSAMAEVCHKLVLDLRYEVDYKKIA